jgi:large subunit ribosomal protein L30
MFAIVRVKGTVNVSRNVEDALRNLNLDTPNRCVVVPDNSSYRGMLQKIKDMAAFGTIDYDTFLAMLKKRGRLTGEKHIDAKTVKETGFDSVDALARAIFDGKTKISAVPSLKSTFRLTPPKRGYKSTKLHYPKGDLGDHKEKISALIKRMI